MIVDNTHNFGYPYDANPKPLYVLNDSSMVIPGERKRTQWSCSGFLLEKDSIVLEYQISYSQMVVVYNCFCGFYINTSLCFRCCLNVLW